MSSYQCCSPDNAVSQKIGELSCLLKLVADNSRLRILCVLKNGERCVCEILDNLSLSQSLISHHLKDLKEAGLVNDRKDGKRVYYTLTDKGNKVTKLIFSLNL